MSKTPPKPDELLPPELHQSVLSLLLFHEKSFQLVRNSLPIETWGDDQGVRALAKATYDFIDTYRKAPGTIHVYEIVYALHVPADVKNNLLEWVSELEDNYQNINVEFTVNRLEKFHRQSTLRAAIQQSMGMIERGELDRVEKLLHDSLKHRLELFHKGSTLLETLTRKMQSTDESRRRDQVFLGIPALDDRLIVPARKKLMVLGGLPKAGKSFFLVHCAKQALLEGKKVLYITLELPEDLVNERLIQSIYGVTKRKAQQLNQLRFDNGHLNSIQQPELMRFSDEGAMEYLADRLTKDRFINNNFLCREYPMDRLTPEGMAALQSNLEMQYGFVADEVCVDYPKLMFKDPRKDVRLAIGSNYESCHSMAKENNQAVVAVAQLNRSGKSSKRTDDEHIGEDFSIVQTADYFLTYNQTDNERTLGTARLYCSNIRDGEGGFEVALTQDYGSAQFVLSSTEMTSDFAARYENLVNPKKDKS